MFITIICPNVSNIYIRTLYVEEHNFFSIAVGVFCSNDVFSSVIEFSSVNDKCVIIASIPLHKLDTLS